MDNERTPAGGKALLDAAEELIRAEGADGWTVSDLAREANLRVDEIESAYDSEWEIFSAVLRRDENGFEEVLHQAESASASDRIVQLFEATVPDFDWTLWIELWSLALRDQRARELRAELDERFRDIIEEIVTEGAASGEFKVDDPRQAAITIATLIDTLATQATLGDTTIRPNYMLDACVAVASELLSAELKLPELRPGGG